MKREHREELDRLIAEAKRKDQRLQKADVLRAARNPKNPLHSWAGWTWDQKQGHEENLLRQAGELIQLYYVVIQRPDGDPIRHRYLVSLTPDRSNGGGFRTMPDVLSDDDLKEQLLRDALAELEQYVAKYRRLEELSGVMDAADDVLERLRSKRRSSKRKPNDRPRPDAR